MTVKEHSLSGFNNRLRDYVYKTIHNFADEEGHLLSQEDTEILATQIMNDVNKTIDSLFSLDAKDRVLVNVYPSKCLIDIDKSNNKIVFKLRGKE